MPKRNKTNYAFNTKLLFAKKLSKLLLLSVIVAFIIQSSRLAKDYYNTYISFGHNIFQKGDILATSTRPAIVTVNYGNQISIGSPLIFGGIVSSQHYNQATWDKFDEIGVTIVRENIFIENELPEGITLQDYRGNVNDIQNPDNWNKEKININNSIYNNAKERGMKVISIFAYAPPWLTYSGTRYGVPKDWAVYEDIVKKVYKLHKDDIDYVEIWNEPTLSDFLDTSGSGLTRQEAYVKIYYHAQKAIREAQNELKESRNVPIGVSVGHDPIDTSILKSLLQDSRTKDSFEFVSYHNYEYIPEPSWENYRKLLKEYKKENSPIYLTEWNYKGIDERNTYYRSGEGSLTYTADRLVKYLEMGLKMANYYALVDVNRPKYENDDPTYGFYKWENNSAELLPQAKTWRLLSKTLGLGAGESKIFDTKTEDENINAIGFINSNKEKGVIFVNKTESDTYITVNIKDLILDKNTKGVPIYVYLASSVHDGSETVDRFYLPKNNKETYTVTLFLPFGSVEALLVPENYDWKDTIRSYFP